MKVSLLLLPLTLATALSPRDIFEITTSLEGIPYPITIISGGTNEYNAKIHEEMAQRDFLVKVKHRIVTKDLLASSSIIIADKLDMTTLQTILNEAYQNRTKMHRVIGQDFPVFVVHNNSKIVENIMANPPIQVHQMIFFINLLDMSIYESYQVSKWELNLGYKRFTVYDNCS